MNTGIIFKVRRVAMMLLCLFVTAIAFAQNTPKGSFDNCTGYGGYISVQGWAYDPDVSSKSISVRVDIYTNSNCTNLYKSVTLTANKARADVNNTYHITGRHGFKSNIEVNATGNYWAKITAIDETGDANTVKGPQTATVTSWVEINSSNAPTTWGEENTVTTYKVTGDVTISDKNITVKGDVTLWLGEGTTLNAERGIRVSTPDKITIDGTGSLVATGKGMNSAGIGNNHRDPVVNSCGEIVINNGHITAKGTYEAAAIGGSGWRCNNNTSCKITINGGVIYAEAGYGAAAIGGGMAFSNYDYFNDWLDDADYIFDYLLDTDGMPGTVVINGGQVTAIADPTVYAIGRGAYASGNSGSIRLGWTEPTDFIYATRLDTELLTIADDRTFVIDDTGIEADVNNLATFYNFALWPDVKTLGSTAVRGIYPSYTYRGEAFMPTYTVTDAFGNTLTEGTDFTAALAFESAPAAQLNATGSYTLTLTGTGQYVGTRTFDIEVVPFSVPTELRHTGYADNSATLEWKVNGGDSGLTLQYSTDNTFATNVTELEVSDSSATIVGLDNELTYYARIKAHNGAATTSWSDIISFEASDKTWYGMHREVEFNSHMLPVDDTNEIGYSQQIYTPEEIGHAGTINSLSLHMGSGRDISGMPLDIYIVYTDKTEFERKSFYWKPKYKGTYAYGFWLTDGGVSYSEADRVFSGTVDFVQNKWNTITFDTPFNYDGLQNVMIIIERTGSCSYSPQYFDRYLICDQIQSIAYITTKTLSDYSWPYTQGNPVVNALTIENNLYSAQGGIVSYMCRQDYDYDVKEKVMSNYSPIKTSFRFGFKEIELADKADNTDVIDDNNNKYGLVTLNDRTIYRDGDWNTLCLPFNVGDATAAEGHHFDGTDLESAIVMQLNPETSNLSADGTLTLNFTDATSIEAGQPYIVKWNLGSFRSDAQGRYVINNAADWDNFASHPDADAVLAADISVSTMAGAFSGTFDGNGHTITVNYGSEQAPIEGLCALFYAINGATIKNLHVTGNIFSEYGYTIGGSFSSGLVGQATGNCTITNCHISTNVNGVWIGDAKFELFNGGIIGRAGKNSNVNITNCLFDGELNGFGRAITGCKGFVGYLMDETSTVSITRSLFEPAAITVLPDYGATFAIGANHNSNYAPLTTGTAIITDCYFTQPLGLPQGIDASGMSATELATALGKQWTVAENKVVPVLSTGSVNLASPSFKWRQIVANAPAGVTTGDGKCTFQGTYDPITFNSTDRSVLFLGSDNKLYYPLSGASIDAFRAYFHVGTPNAVKELKLTFGEEEDATSIHNSQFIIQNEDDAVYDLSGRKLNSKFKNQNSKLPSGIYIVNGQKVVIK